LEDLRDKFAHLKGTVSALGLEAKTPEGRVLLEMVDLLDLVVQRMAELKASQEELGEYLESVDEDLYELEGEVYGSEEEEAQGDGNRHAEVECPQCRKIVCFDEDLLDEEGSVEVFCPDCNALVFSTHVD
jgi:phage FluMu protein Com